MSQLILTIRVIWEILLQGNSFFFFFCIHSSLVLSSQGAWSVFCFVLFCCFAFLPSNNKNNPPQMFLIVHLLFSLQNVETSQASYHSKSKGTYLSWNFRIKKSSMNKVKMKTCSETTENLSKPSFLIHLLVSPFIHGEIRWTQGKKQGNADF